MIVTVTLLASTAGAVPYVALDAGALAPQACSGAGCWTNHLRVVDIEPDGDLDVVLANYADFFSGGDSPEPLVLYTNDGTGALTNVSAAALGGHQGNHRQIAIGDVTGDGSPEIFGPSGDGSAPALFVNDGSGNFTDEATTRLPAGASPAGAAARMGDVDGDGDLDLFAADGYATSAPPFGHLYLNDGAGVFTEAAGALPTQFSGSDPNDVEFADVDRDFDLDLVINAHGGGIGALWLNDGTGVFTASNGLDAPGAGSQFHYNVTPCDVDGDGDLDLWVDNTGGNYREQLQINDGTGVFADETAARVTGNVSGADDNGVVCVDLDDDGDLDAVVLSLSTAERLLVNDGAGNFSALADAFPAGTDCTLWGEFGDLDGDQRLDLVTGQGECSSTDQVYLGTTDQPTDSQPPRILAATVPTFVDQGAPAAALFAVSDRTVTDGGPQLTRAYATGGSEDVDATFVGGDLFRVALPTGTAGTFDIQLCAIDRAGNAACSVAFPFEVVAAGTDPTTTDTTDTTDPTGTTDTTPTDGSTTADTGTGGGADEGCGCATGAPAGGWALVPLLWLARRRRGLSP